MKTKDLIKSLGNGEYKDIKINAPKYTEKMNINGITRFELIEKENGREKVIYNNEIEVEIQDDCRTLKVFYDKNKNKKMGEIVND